MVKFLYSEKATEFCKIFPLPLSYVVPVKSKVEILQNFVAFSEYMNFTWEWFCTFFGGIQSEKVLGLSYIRTFNEFPNELDVLTWVKVA